MVYFSGVHSMSEVTGQLEQGTPADAEAGRQPSAGEMLRQARESAGLSIATLAVALKVSVKRLEALEADRLDLLPDAVFVRALASSVCRALKIDPAPVLSRLPQTAVPRLDVDGGGLKTPFQTPGDVTHVSAWSQLSRPVVLAALTLLVGALVLIFFPSMDSMLVSVATAPETATPAPTAASTEDAAPVVNARAWSMFCAMGGGSRAKVLRSRARSQRKTVMLSIEGKKINTSAPTSSVNAASTTGLESWLQAENMGDVSGRLERRLDTAAINVESRHSGLWQPVQHWRRVDLQGPWQRYLDRQRANEHGVGREAVEPIGFDALPVS